MSPWGTGIQSGGAVENGDLEEVRGMRCRGEEPRAKKIIFDMRRRPPVFRQNVGFNVLALNGSDGMPSTISFR
jgi:hypothetical protein